MHTSEGTVRCACEANVAAVMGQMPVGGGHRSLEEVMCTIGIPWLSKPTFINIKRLLGSAFEDHLNDLMLREERESAIKNSIFKNL